MNIETFQGFEIIHSEKIKEYDYCGVWAMFGIDKLDNARKYTCLNVGKSKRIRKKLEFDFERLSEFKLSQFKEYRNQFNEKKFPYIEYASRQDFLYKELSEKYEEIKFILVAKQTDNTYTIEKYFAYSTKSAYWVSNGRYNPNQMICDFEIERIRNNIDISKIDKELIKKINKFKEWYDNQDCGNYPHICNHH